MSGSKVQTSSHDAEAVSGEGSEGLTEVEQRIITNSQTHLLRLPYELTDLIWNLCLYVPRMHTVHKGNSKNRQDFFVLGQVCKQLRSEMQVAMERRFVYIRPDKNINSLVLATQFLHSAPTWAQQSLRKLHLGRLRVSKLGSDNYRTYTYTFDQEKFFASLESLQLAYLGITFDTEDIQKCNELFDTRAFWLVPFLGYQKKKSMHLQDARLEMGFTSGQGARSARIELLIRRLSALRIEGLNCSWRS